MSELGPQIGEINNRLQKARSEADAIEDMNVRRAVQQLAEAVDELKQMVKEIEARTASSAPGAMSAR